MTGLRCGSPDPRAETHIIRLFVSHRHIALEGAA